MVAPWIAVEDLDNPVDLELAERAIEVATLMLYKLSGQKYPGIRTVTEKYKLDANGMIVCFQVFDIPTHLVSTAPTLKNSFFLRGKPIVSVELVETSEGVLNVGGFAIANRSELVRTSGFWDMRSGVTVTYTYGLKPPEMGRQAAITLANEFLALWTDPDECRLPERVTSVARQGLTFQLGDASAALANQQTGIYEVDAFIAVHNPDRAKKRPKVFSPDIPRGKRYI